MDFVEHSEWYRARRGVIELLDVPDARYLAIDGHGDPNGSEFGTAVSALYPVAYALKFGSKNDAGRDYVVPPLEGLWWADEMATFTDERDKTRWDWTLMMLVPDWLDDEAVAAASAKVRHRSERVGDVRVLLLSEGLCAQTLHVGPYDTEADVLATLHHEFVPQHRLRLTGRHHEIYLGDHRRVAPEKRRTILRQPVRRTS